VNELHATALVRRALRAGASWLPAATAALSPTDRADVGELERWFAGFAAEVRAHHETIETWLLPTLAVRRALGHDVLEAIAVDHACVDHVVGELGDALGVLAFGLADGVGPIAAAHGLALRLERLLDAQLARESHLLAPLVTRTLRPVERLAVDGEVLCGITVRRAPFSLDWLCAQLTDAEREALLALAPIIGAAAD